MENLENNELTSFQEEVVTKVNKRKAFGSAETELTELEAGILARRSELNFPALQAFYGLTETELQTILDKLPPVEDCNC